MKFHQYLLCFLVSVLFLTSCQDKKNEPNPTDPAGNNPAAPGQMIANVNG